MMTRDDATKITNILTLQHNSKPTLSTNATKHTSNKTGNYILLEIETKSTTNGAKLIETWANHDDKE